VFVCIAELHFIHNLGYESSSADCFRSYPCCGEKYINIFAEGMKKRNDGRNINANMMSESGEVRRKEIMGGNF
jgi:hypothetical protein